MLQKNQRFLNQLNIGLDAVIIFISYILAVYVRFHVMGGKSKLNILSGEDILIVALVLSVAATAAMFMFHVHRMFFYDNVWEELKQIVFVNTMVALCLIATLYIFKIIDFPRLIVFFNWAIANILMCIKYVILKAIVHSYRSKEQNLHHILIAGAGHTALQYMEDIQKNPQYGLVVDGYVSTEEKPELGRLLGTYEEFDEILEKYPADEVVIALEPHELKYMKNIMEAVDKEGIRLSIIPFYSDYIPPYSKLELIGRSKLIDMRATPLDNLLNAFLKRFGDIVGSMILIILTSPVMLVTAIGVKLSSPGPVFLRQERVGRYKKPFIMLKFRSMRVNDEENVGWSTNEDPRRTKFGSFIRKFSIDELPQLFNVLIGQMSLIGPRPEMPYHVSHFKEDVPLYLVRQQVRPGMTGWAQVNGLRGATSIEKRVEYDIWYIENWSIGLEIRIFFKTLFGGMINKEII
jgi:Undecaprenyl-phosphate glucose phosphotransferase